MADSAGLERLAEAIRARRAHLGLAQGDLASRGGPSIVTVGQLERGQIERPQAATLARLERALDWTAGHASALVAGVAVDVPADVRREGEDPVLAAIRADTRLVPEAREHLLRQYGLLLRIRADADVEALHEQAREEMFETERQERLRAVPEGGARDVRPRT